ncbi:MAG: HIT family protein [Candidatus Aenigmarchaeota archaeon]|nr:HIT family protein [Candidatus Aenigmarchaeota archaeon]
MDECLFCKIVKGEIPSDKVYEDTNFLAFLDINPRNPGHTLVIPKRHYETIFDMPDGETGSMLLMVKKVAAAVKNTMKADGISIGQSNGRAAGQVISHLHFHVIPRYLTEGPPGLESIVPVKKLPPDTMKKAAEMVKANFGRPVESVPAPPESQPRPAEQRASGQARPGPEEKSSKKPPKEEDLFDF